MQAACSVCEGDELNTAIEIAEHGFERDKGAWQALLASAEAQALQGGSVTAGQLDTFVEVECNAPSYRTAKKVKRARHRSNMAPVEIASADSQQVACNL